jgi:hypothetical protein
MIRKELKDKILAYNRESAKQNEKSSDMDTLIAALGRLPWGQLKKLLTDDVVAVLNKYGIGKEQ